jgi:NYN domain
VLVTGKLTPRRAMYLHLRIIPPSAKKQIQESTPSSPVALLIDGENMVSAQMPQILSEAGKLGEISIRRVYGNWTTNNFHRQWSDSVIRYALEPIHHIEAKSGCNGSDIALVIGAMDILHSHTIKNFCLVTSDSDYTPLVMRLRADGCIVYGFGRPNTPELLKKAFTKFIPTEGFGPTTPESTQTREATSDSINSTKATPTSGGNPAADVFSLTDLFINAYRVSLTLTADNDGWVPIQLFGNQLMLLDSKYKEPFGKMNLTTLIKKRSDLFETQLRNTTLQIEIRLLPQPDESQ